MKLHHPQLQVARHEVYKFCCEYAKCPKRGKSLVIYGDNGTGKSRISRCIAQWAKRIAINLPLVVDQLGTQGNMSIPSVSFASWPEVVDGFKRDEWQLLEDMQAASMLVIDDIGAEHDPSKIGVEKLYVLLNRREFRWNVFSTNVTPDNWPEKFERRISSRLFRNAHHIDLSQVPDYSTT
jgi:DNA replication protein DnaC